jgi:type VI secretion system secreted protein Hcp
MAGSKFLLTMQLTTQGKIRGGGSRKGGSLDTSKGIECHAFEYGTVVPYDSHTGLTSGKRQHSPITVTREVDSASPKLYQALCTNEAFTEATISFFKPSKEGKPVVYHTITLTNGAIADIRQFGVRKGKRCESISLDYESIKINGLPTEIEPIHWLRRYA